MLVLATYFNIFTQMLCNGLFQVKNQNRFEDNMDVDTENGYYIVFKLDYVWAFLVAPVGIVGNILAIIVLTKKSKDSMSFLLTVLGISDCFILITGSIFNLSRHVLRFMRRGTVMCSVFDAISLMCIKVSSWILVIVSIERLFCILFPIRMKTLWKRKYTIICFTITMFILAMLTTVEVFNERGDDSGCYLDLTILPMDVGFWISSLFAFIIPFIFIVLTSVMIVITFLYKTKIRSNQSQNRSVVVTVLMVNTVFVITMSPVHVLSLFEMDFIDPFSAQTSQINNNITSALSRFNATDAESRLHTERWTLVLTSNSKQKNITTTHVMPLQNSSLNQLLSNDTFQNHENQTNIKNITSQDAFTGTDFNRYRYYLNNLNSNDSFLFLYYLVDLNACLNIFVYFLSATRFRNDFLEHFGLRKPIRSHQIAQRNTTATPLQSMPHNSTFEDVLTTGNNAISE